MCCVEDLAADLVYLIAQAEVLERGDGGLDDVGVIAGSQGLREDIADARGLDYGADAAAGDDAGTGRRRLEQDAAATEFPNDLMRDGVLEYGDLDQGFAGGIGSFADGLGDFIGLAETEADAALAIPGNDEGAEREAAATLDDLGASVDENDLLGEVGLIAAGVAAAITLIISAFAGFSHKLKFEASFTGGVGKGLDLAMVLQAAAVEDDLGDILGLAALGNETADFHGRVLVCAGFLVSLEITLGGIRGSDGFALLVIDDLGVNVLR